MIADGINQNFTQQWICDNSKESDIVRNGGYSKFAERNVGIADIVMPVGISDTVIPVRIANLALFNILIGIANP